VSRAVVAKDLVVAQARSLKMPGVVRVLESLARQAREEHWGYEEFLHEVLSAEQTSRRDSAVRHRLREARFPEMKTLDTFDFAATDGAISATQIAELARGEWIGRADNIIFAGPIGTGKTHLAIALGIEAARQRRRVLFTRAADIVRSLLEARDARELGRLQRRLYQVDLLVLDELGFVPFDRAGGELLFNLLTERYERRSVIVTTTSQRCSRPVDMLGRSSVDDHRRSRLCESLGDGVADARRGTRDERASSLQFNGHLESSMSALRPRQPEPDHCRS
jgi:DNA replication protein DnaC